MVGSVEKTKISFQVARIFLAAMLFFCVSRAAHAQTCAVTVDKTVNICAPASGSTDNSPVQFTAAALDQEHPITGMIAYVDSVQKAQSGNASLSASVQLAAGTHNIVIRAWDSTGFFFSSQETITVVNPAVTIVASPAQITAGRRSTPTGPTPKPPPAGGSHKHHTNTLTLSPAPAPPAPPPPHTTVYTATATGTS